MQLYLKLSDLVLALTKAFVEHFILTDYSLLYTLTCCVLSTRLLHPTYEEVSICVVITSQRIMLQRYRIHIQSCPLLKLLLHRADLLRWVWKLE